MSLSDLQLSRMVAEKIYGFHLLKNAPMRMTRVVNAKGTAAGMLVEDVPLYATDPGLALEAAMKASGSVGVYWQHYIGIHGPDTAGAFANSGSTFAVVIHGVATRGSTLPRALCLAALRAAGHEVEDDKE